MTADCTVSHDKNPKFGENAQAQLPSVTNFQFSTCRTDAFTQGDQAAKLTIVLVSGAKNLLVECFGGEGTTQNEQTERTLSKQTEL